MASHHELQTQGNPLTLAQVISLFETQQSGLEKITYQSSRDSTRVCHGQKKQDTQAVAMLGFLNWQEA